MAPGSQLAQLKRSLSDANLSHTSHSRSSKRRRSVSQESLKAGTLKQIREKLNPFDHKVTKLKHDVGGRAVKGRTGKPALKKQAGIAERERTLLPELAQRNRKSSFVDRRFGENDPTMTPEERMLERFTKERQRASKGVNFNLEDEDELTHYGQSLSNLDDFDDVALDNEDGDEDDTGQLDKEHVRTEHFGGFSDSPAEQDRKKSKAEVMSEVIAKSKEHKYMRQMEKEEENNIRQELDRDFLSIQALLSELRSPSNAPTTTEVHDGERKVVPDAAYDRVVRELAFDGRSRPKDRTKTEEEIALEQKTALEKAERKRLKRMQGLDDASSDDDTHLRKKRRRKGEADDLEDGILLEDEWNGLGEGLGNSVQEEDIDDHESENAESVIDSATDADEEDSIESTNLKFNEQEGSDADGDDDASSRVVRQGKKLRSTTSNTKERVKKDGSNLAGSNHELPFTFECPESHEQWLEMIDAVGDQDIKTVIERILTLYHPSLASDNKQKLDTFNLVLVEHVLHLSALTPPRFDLLDTLTHSIFKLCQMSPLASAQIFKDKLVIMQKNLTRGLSKDPSSSKAKTWPGASELVFLRLLGAIWSTSDMEHCVVGPARLLIGAYLELASIRQIKDIGSGLFLCTIFLQYEALSKRFIPEVPAFLTNAIVLLVAPDSEKLEDSSILAAGRLPQALQGSLVLNGKPPRDLVPSKVNLGLLLSHEGVASEQTKVDLLSTCFKLIARTAEVYNGLPGFIELFQPIQTVMESMVLDGYTTLENSRLATTKVLRNLIKFSQQARRPLSLQMHKPIAIASYAPKFSSMTSTYMHVKDPDRERAAAAKLKREYKQERKGALRELRKDATFLAKHQQARQEEKDKAYNLSMKRVLGNIEGERAEEKKMVKEQQRDRKRSGRK